MISWVGLVNDLELSPFLLTSIQLQLGQALFQNGFMGELHSDNELSHFLLPQSTVSAKTSLLERFHWQGQKMTLKWVIACLAGTKVTEQLHARVCKVTLNQVIASWACTKVTSLKLQLVQNLFQNGFMSRAGKCHWFACFCYNKNCFSMVSWGGLEK